MSGPEPFAKLFDTVLGQLLVTTENGSSDESGPCLKIRAAALHGVEPSISHGPWPDDTAGWAKVAKLLADFDQEQADDWAAKLTGMVTNLLADAQP